MTSTKVPNNKSNSKEYLAFLHVRRIDTGEIVKSIGLTSLHPNYVQRVIGGMLINMHPDYYVDDSETDVGE